MPENSGHIYFSFFTIFRGATRTLIKKNSRPPFGGRAISEKRKKSLNTAITPLSYLSFRRALPGLHPQDECAEKKKLDRQPTPALPRVPASLRFTLLYIACNLSYLCRQQAPRGHAWRGRKSEGWVEAFRTRGRATGRCCVVLQGRREGNSGGKLHNYLCFAGCGRNQSSTPVGFDSMCK